MSERGRGRIAPENHGEIMREAWERNNPGVPYPGDLEDNVGIQESLPDNNNQNQENEKETK